MTKSTELGICILASFLSLAVNSVTGAQELSKAVLANDEAKVRQLLADGIDVNKSKAGEATPVFFVQSVRVLNLLIDGGAHFDSVVQKETPLEAAAVAGLTEIVSALRKRGARYTLKAAIILNDLQFLKSELSSMPKLANEPVIGGELPLSIAVESGTVESTAILLEYGADPSGTMSGRPVILSSLGRPELLKKLIDKGANLRRRVAIRNAFLLGEEPSILHFALLEGNLESIKICVMAGLDVNGVDANGLSILGLAILLASAESSPLIAPDRPNNEIIQFLLENDVSLILLARDKKDAVAFAIESRCPEALVEILKKKQNRAVR